MSDENKSEILSISWTNDTLQRALRNGTAQLAQNDDGKAKSDCWKKFKLVETTDGKPIFGCI